ncbi:MAG: hypothetical protein PSW75_11905 [bacterium]|nr:hypothetical protein [bacterium]MDI1336697.1 hypothetical protein [Lacunisphaera sp.]
MVLRWFMFVVLLLSLAGCAKPADLPDVTVSAALPSEFAQFRAELGTRFTPEQLKDFDTATQELQLDGMNRNITTAAGRELDMLAAVNGQPVHVVVRLGWQARRERFHREIATLTKMLDGELEAQAKNGDAGPSQAALARMQSERGVIAKLQANLAETDRRLTELRQAKP